MLERTDLRTPESMQLFLCGSDAEAELQSELNDLFRGAQVQRAGPLLFQTEFSSPARGAVLHVVFARQWLPNAETLHANSIRDWANALYSAIVGRLPDGLPWRLHIEPHYGAQAVHRMGARAWHVAHRQQHPRSSRALSTASMATGLAKVQSDAGRHRCRLIRNCVIELLQARRRHLRRLLNDEPAIFAPDDSLVQLWLTGPETGFLSIAPAPLPFKQRYLLSPFPKGAVPVASDKNAPSRAFAKLIEAERRFGRAIRPGESCVDLGAAPGSWSYVALQRGARVHAIDRSPLRHDLMLHSGLEFSSGDAFCFKPQNRVDWLLCDVIAAADRTVELLLNWLRRRWCRRFIVTLKMQRATEMGALGMLKRQLPGLTSEFFLLHLNANKNEVSAFGTAAFVHAASPTGERN